MTSILRRVVVAALLAAWSFPAMAATNVNTGTPAAVVEKASGQASRTGETAQQAQGYAEREQQSQDLTNFQGGEGYVYIGGSVLTAALLIVLILILI